MRLGSSWLLGVLVCCIALGASHAGAQATSALRIGALRSSERTPLALVSETIVVECEAPASSSTEEVNDDGPMPCTVRVAYELSNPDAEVHAVSLRFTVENAEERFEIGEAGAPGRSEAPILRAQRFPFESGSSRTLELIGSPSLVRSAPPGFGQTDGLRARHPVLATGFRSETRGFIYRRAVTRHFVSAPEDVIIRARLPAGYVIHVDGGVPVPDESIDGWTVISVHRPDSEADPHMTLEIQSAEEELPIRNGGPFLALGGVALVPPGIALPNAFYGRLGYEIGFVDFLILSVALETNFSSIFAIGAMLEAASPSFGLPPSFSIGIGSAIRILPQPTASLRLAVGTTVYSIGFEALFDYFPAEGGFTIILLGRAGI